MRLPLVLNLFGLLLLSACAKEAGDPAAQEVGHTQSDQQQGEFIALEKILADAERRQPGRIVDVELEGATYEIEVLRADGVLVELEYDAKHGRLLDIEIDD